MQTLKSVLSNNISVTGTSCENLGKFIGRGIFRRKVFLSHDSKKGWGVAKLNLIQLFVRKIFGLYRYTHLQTIVHASNEVIIKEKYSKNESSPSQLYARIRHLWTKHYPKKVFPTFGLITGNAEIDQAQLICLSEIHTDKINMKYNAAIIEKYYRPGDIILVEGLDAGHVIKAKEQPTCKYLPKEIEYAIFGWEPPGTEKENEGIGAATKNVKDKLLKAKDQLKAAIPPNTSWTPENTQKLKQEVLQFCTALPDIVGHYEKDKARRDKFVSTTQTILLDVIREGKFENKSAVFEFGILEITKKILSEIDKVKYEHFSWQELNKIDQNFFYRNVSLCQEINNYISTGKRVFVIGGMEHLLPCSLKINDVQATQKKYKYTVVAAAKHLPFHCPGYRKGEIKFKNCAVL